MGKFTASLRDFWDVPDIETAKHERVLLPRQPENWSDAYQERLIHPLLAVLPEKPATILDYGCGVGRISRQLLRAGYDVVGIDVSEHMLTFARELCKPYDARWLLSDGYRIPLPDRSVAAAVCFYVFQHMPHWEMVDSCLREVWRCLTTSGVFVAQSIDLFESTFADYDKASFVGVRQQCNHFCAAAARVGFAVSEAQEIHCNDHIYYVAYLRKLE